MTMPTHDTAPTDAAPRPIPVAVQILSILLFAGFAISVSITAMAFFWPAGIALAVLFAWQWARIPTLSGGRDLDRAVAGLKPDLSEGAARSTGNASFNAYRRDLLARLEREQTQFDAFLDRLRDAKDRMEFDRFMEARATRTGPDRIETDPGHASRDHAA